MLSLCPKSSPHNFESNITVGWNFKKVAALLFLRWSTMQPAWVQLTSPEEKQRFLLIFATPPWLSHIFLTSSCQKYSSTKQTSAWSEIKIFPVVKGKLFIEQVYLGSSSVSTYTYYLLIMSHENSVPIPFSDLFFLLSTMPFYASVFLSFFFHCHSHSYCATKHTAAALSHYSIWVSKG